MNKREEIAKTLYCKYSEELAKEYRTSWEDCPQVHSYYLECADAILAITTPITVECRECGGSGNKTISFNPNLNPNKFPAVECRKVPCPHCTNGQRVIMKVRKCDPCREDIPCKENCEHIERGFDGDPGCKVNGKITSPLTLADIDFTGEIKLKGEIWHIK